MPRTCCGDQPYQIVPELRLSFTKLGRLPLIQFGHQRGMTALPLGSGDTTLDEISCWRWTDRFCRSVGHGFDTSSKVGDVIHAGAIRRLAHHRRSGRLGACVIIQPTIEGSRPLRLLTILMLYVAQGIPIGLFDFAIPAWMATNGATGGEIGYVIGMGGLPWSLKFINGFLMDRFTFLAMGRRRSWLIGAQFAMVAALLVSALLSPSPRDVFLIGAIALVVNAAVVFQDVAADALAVDVVRGRDEGLVGGLMAGGQALGIAISASAASLVIFLFGPGAAYLNCAAIMACVMAYLVWIRERQGERRLPWTFGQAATAVSEVQHTSWKPLVRSAFRHLVRPHSLVWVGGLFLMGTIYGIMTVAVPLIAANYAGWNEARLGATNGTAQLLAAIVTITAGGWLTSKLGAKPFQLVTIALFAGGLLAYLSIQDLWGLTAAMTGLVLGWTVILFLMGAPRATITMMFCNPKTGATQFSIYMAFHNQGISFAGFTFAYMQGFGGVAAALMILVGILTLAGVVVAAIRLPGEAERHVFEKLAPAT